MDLISRQAAIEPKAISEWKKEFREYVDSLDITRDDWKGIIEYINEIPSAQPEHTETHSCDYQRTVTHDWIPVTERLPVERTNPNTLDFERVLCSTTFGDVRAYKFGTPMGHSEPHFWHGAGLMDEYVVAWMPLPEPYGGEEE